MSPLPPQTATQDRLSTVLLGASPASLGTAAMETALLRARELDVYPFVVGSLRRAERALPPGEEARWREQVARSALLRHELGRFCQALANVEHVVLKGLPFAVRLFDDLDGRESHDIDVLVRLADVESALSALQTAGYRPAEGRAVRPAASNQIKCVHSKLGVAVELHWGLTVPWIPAPPVDAVLSRRVPVELGGGLVVNGLDDAMMMWVAGYHFHQHGGFLKGLIDVAAWVDRISPSVDMGQLFAEASELGVWGILGWSLATLERLTGCRPHGLAAVWPMRVRLWSAWSARATRGALARRARFRGGSALSFKTRDLLRGEVIAWRSAGATLLDRWPERAHAALEPVLGAGDQNRTPAAMLARPALLVGKQLADLVAMGRDHWRDRRDPPDEEP